MVTFESFLTPEGVIVAAGAVTGFVALIKGVFPPIAERVSGALMAFIVTGVLYGATAWAVGVADPNAGLVIVFSWLGCATSAVGIRETVVHVRPSE